MSERRQLGRFVLHESAVSESHAHVRVFESGGFCGALTMSRGAWEGLKPVPDPPAGGGDGNPSEPSVSGRGEFDVEAEV